MLCWHLSLGGAMTENEASISIFIEINFKPGDDIEPNAANCLSPVNSDGGWKY